MHRRSNISFGKQSMAICTMYHGLLCCVVFAKFCPLSGEYIYVRAGKSDFMSIGCVCQCTYYHLETASGFAESLQQATTYHYVAV